MERTRHYRHYEHRGSIHLFFSAGYRGNRDVYCFSELYRVRMHHRYGFIRDCNRYGATVDWEQQQRLEYSR